MKIWMDLFLTFMKIGFFTFGGGYAMIPIIEDTCVEKKKWLSHDDMMNIAVIAESTPGPMAINCATFTGYRQAGFFGSLAATAGIILPSFLLSEKSGRLKFVLAHEAAHVRRGDNLWKVIMLLAVCIHWFNPLVWLMYVLFSRDMELSCDERVLSRFGEGAKREYARALVGLAEKQYRRSLFAQGFGKSAIKERIEAIMKFKKTTAVSAACAVLLLGTAVTVFAQTDLREISIHENDISAAQEEDGVDSSNAAQAEAPAGNADESMETDLGLIDDLVNSEEFREYEAYGVSYDRESGDLLYNGEPVGFLYIVEENGGEIEMAVALPDDLEEESETTTGICVSKDAEGKIIGVTKIEGPSVTIEDGETSVEAQDN